MPTPAVAETQTPITSTFRSYLATFSVSLFCLFIVMINAWITDDAYISFRSIEQWFAGNGLRWNPHERVQVFTHPLWLMVMSIPRMFSSDMFLNMLGVSVICLGLSVFLLYRFTKQQAMWVGAVMLLCSSRAWVDFSTSGLENPLSHLLIIAFAFLLIELQAQEDAVRERSVFKLTFVFALALTNRLDLATLLMVPYLWAFLTTIILKKRLSWGLFLKLLVVASPPLIWTIFSVIYYGFPFPNTAYAKLGAGVDTGELMSRGFLYFLNSLRGDPITLAAMALALLISLKNRSVVLLALAAGLICNLVYVMRVGGDFMAGRFLTSAFTLAVCILFSVRWSKHWLLALAISLLLYNGLYKAAPLHTRENYSYKSFDSGIADERGYYFRHASLWRYIQSKQDQTYFPFHDWVVQGKLLAQSSYRAAVMICIGYYGYSVRLNQIVVDPVALADPLLARLPAEPGWRIGHMLRTLPPGYLESVGQTANLIQDPQIYSLYRDLRLVTEGPLFTWERWQAIFKLNLGQKS